MKSIALLTLPALLLASVSAIAADEDSSYVIWGVGQKSCNSYNQARAAAKYDEFKAYAAGYLTAYNAFMPETYNIAPGKDIEAVLTWLDEHCSDSKTNHLADALHRFIEEFHDGRETAAPGSGARWP